MSDTVFVGGAYWDKAANGEVTQGLFRVDRKAGALKLVTDGLPDDLEVRHIILRGTDTIYVGAQDGIYRSHDGGNTWTHHVLPGTERRVWSILPVGEKTLYVGTEGTSVYKSEDDGDTFTALDVPKPAGFVNMGFPNRVIRMAADPANPDEIYVGLEVSGVVRSLDGGRTWTDCSAGLIDLANNNDRLKSRIGSDTHTEGMMDLHSLAISPTHPGTVIIANRLGLFVSHDKGDSWAEMGIGKYSDLTYCRDVQVFPHNPETLLAAFSDSARGVKGSLYRSDDFGRTWKRFDHGVSMNSTVMILGASRQTPDRVYCAARKGQVFGTEDGGKSWREFKVPPYVKDICALACV
jgi:photosystem II stability/assembly factor-like uncharacterized protein